MTSGLLPSASATVPDAATDARPGSSFTALTRRVHDLDLMRRRYGYYWTKLIGAVLILAAWILAFNARWELALRGDGHDGSTLSLVRERQSDYLALTW